MRLQVRLHGALRRHRPADAGGAPHHSFAVELAAGSRVSDLMQLLEIPRAATHAAVNGRAVEPEQALRDGDEVHLFPPAAGGCGRKM